MNAARRNFLKAAGSGIALTTVGAGVVSSSWPMASFFKAPEQEPMAAQLAPGTITTVAGTGGPGFSVDGIPAIAAQLAYPQALVVAPDSRVLFAESESSRVRAIEPDGTIRTVAGTGEEGFSGDGGPATEARLGAYGPHGLAVAPDMTIYVADRGNQRIRRIDPDGTITTIAGTGAFGFTGDGGPATEARLANPTKVAVGSDGSVFITDGNDRRVRRISPEGVITTVAGTGTAGFSGDGGPAAAGELNGVMGLAVGPDGALYISDQNNHRIRRVNTGGTIETVAGTGIAGSSGDGGPAVAARLNGPAGITLAPDGSLYIVERYGSRVRQVATEGTIRTVAGGRYGYLGDGVPALDAGLTNPTAVAIGMDGSIYIADLIAHRIRRVDTNGIIWTIAGRGGPGYAGDGGQAVEAELQFPSGVTLAPDGTLYIADQLNHRIRVVGLSGLITTFAGTGEPGFLGDGGLALEARFLGPSSVTLGADGSLYVADRYNHRVRRVSPDGIIATIAGTGIAGGTGDGGAATRAQLRGPRNVALGPDGSLYIADSDNHRVRRVGRDGTIQTVAGTGTAGSAGDGGPATQGQLRFPSGVAVSLDGVVFIADTGNHRIRRVDKQGMIATWAGTGEAGTGGDGGPAVAARLNGPRGLAIGPDGAIYIADNENHRIRRVDLSGAITTFAGNRAGYRGDGQLATEAELRHPEGLAFGPGGSLYIADNGNQRIRKVDTVLEP